MSINDINNAAAAMNQLKARYDGFLDDADGQIATRQAAYDALSGNLKGIVDDKMFQRIYVNAQNGSDTSEGSESDPIETIQEAFARTTPGSLLEVRLTRGETYVISRDLPLNAENCYIVINTWGDATEPLPVIQQDITNISNSGYASGFILPSCVFRAFDIRFETALNPDNLGLTGFTSFFETMTQNFFYLRSCEISIGDIVPFTSRYNEPIWINFYNVDIERRAGANNSTTKLINASGGILRATGVTLPSGDAWSDLISGQVYAADGEARNFITNVQI